MDGISIAAAITTVLAIAAWGSLLRQMSDPADRRILLALTALATPLSPAVFYGVRLPLDAWLAGLLGKESGLYTALKLCYAPLTEEPAKLLPLLLLLPLAFPITRRNTAPIAMALGLGFGIGEIWLIANFVRENPNLGGLPFYAFGGFVSERMLVCLTHGGFTVLAVWALSEGRRWFPLGFLGAMVAHFLANFPIYLKAINFGGLGAAWDVIISLWLMLYFFGSLALLMILRYGLAEFKRLAAGKARCPSCGELYNRPIMGMNAGFRRYEPCTLCKKWHWIDARDNIA